MALSVHSLHSIRLSAHGCGAAPPCLQVVNLKQNRTFEPCACTMSELDKLLLDKTLAWELLLRNSSFFVFSILRGIVVLGS